jgi:signal transduction histidine kinase
MIDPRSSALAQLVETTLSERLGSPVFELLEAIPTALAIVEAQELRVLAINSGMAAILGHSSSELVGSRIGEIVPPGSPLSDPATFRKAAVNGRPHDLDVILAGRPMLLFVRPLNGSQLPADFLLMGLTETPVSAQSADVVRLEEANAAKSEFLRMAAHELRTPLGVIHGYGSMLAQGGLSPEHQQLAGLRVYEKAKQLSRLIMDMMLAARLDEVLMGLALDELDLVPLLESLVSDATRRFPDLAITFSCPVEEAPLQGNPEWLGLALRELIDNGARFRPGPGRLEISLRAENDCWRVDVVDDGLGIDPAEQSRLFRRFSRLETDENSQLVGLGIGLYLVREVVLAHHGRVQVKSRPRVGSEFSVELPLKQA